MGLFRVTTLRTLVAPFFCEMYVSKEHNGYPNSDNVGCVPRNYISGGSVSHTCIDMFWPSFPTQTARKKAKHIDVLDFAFFIQSRKAAGTHVWAEPFYYYRRLDPCWVLNKIVLNCCLVPLSKSRKTYITS